jgi:hypothetical protein
MYRQSKSNQACRAYLRQAPRLLELSGDDPLRVEWLIHARSCADCRQLIESHTAISQRLSHLADSKPAFVRARVMAAVRDSRRPVRLLQPRRVAWGLATGLAGAALGFLLVNLEPAVDLTATLNSQTSYASVVTDGFDQVAAELVSTEVEAKQ